MLVRVARDPLGSSMISARAGRAHSITAPNIAPSAVQNAILTRRIEVNLAVGIDQKLRQESTHDYSISNLPDIRIKLTDKTSGQAARPNAICRHRLLSPRPQTAECRSDRA